MCTLAVALGADPRWPVVVAANRDERLGRPAEGWALREAPGGARYAAPRDLTAGGTWIGVSARGAVAALTNYHAPLDWYPDDRRRSRGELVPLALAAPGARRSGARGETPGAQRASAARRPERSRSGEVQGRPSAAKSSAWASAGVSRITAEERVP